MPRVLLNVDLGELPDEDEELYALAHVANVACGGHAGDAASMRLSVDRCARRGARVGAHPSYEDREGFGRREQRVPPEVLEAQVASQCAALRAVAFERGCAVGFAKPHGALYHAAGRDPAVARAVAAGVKAALGDVVLIGPAAGALREAARAAGLRYAREGFVDRATRPDGTLVPRGEPGAVISDPAAARENALRLATSGALDTLCVHGDSPGAGALARAAREVLDVLALRPRPLGEGALLLPLPDALDRGAAQAALLRAPDVTDVVLAESLVAVHFDPGRPPPEVRVLLARALGERGRERRDEAVVVRVRYDGPDLGRVAGHAGLTAEDVARLHAAGEYRVRFVGFLPGFAYLGDVDPLIAAPRLASPRPRVPPLSVAIAGSRTAVYPFASPGGWNLIGTAEPLELFRPDSGARLMPGTRVRFERVG